MTYDRELRTEAAHALTHNSEVWADRGYAVVTAGGLSEGDTDFELDVGPYDVLVGDTDETSVGPTTLSVNAPDTDPYWLVVYVDGEGLQTEQGPEGEVFVGDQSVDPASADVREITSPAPPTLADIGPVTVLGKVLVTSSGVTDSLIDDRVFQSERVFDVVNSRSASVEEITIDSTIHYAADDADLDSILNVVRAGDKIILGKSEFIDNRTINTDGLTLEGVSSYQFIGDGPVISGDWSIDALGVSVYNVAFDGANVDLAGDQIRFVGCQLGGDAEITNIDTRRNVFVAFVGGGNSGTIVFDSATDSCVVDSSSNITVTDNGNNVVGDIT